MTGPIRTFPSCTGISRTLKPKDSSTPVFDIDWSGLGGKRTVCMCKPFLGESSILLSNAVTIDGTLGDGHIMMDVVLNRRRMQILEEELEKLVGSCSGQTNSHVLPKRVLSSKL